MYHRCFGGKITLIQHKKKSKGSQLVYHLGIYVHVVTSGLKDLCLFLFLAFCFREKNFKLHF